MSKPTRGSIQESLEVIWEVIHEWSADMQNHEVEEREHERDDVKLAMNWIMEELGYTYDESGEIVKGESAS